MTKRNKAIIYDYDRFSTFPADEKHYLLTDGQAALLVAVSRYFQWSTRWINEPANFDYDEFAADIMTRLLTPIEVSMFDCNDVENCLGTSPIIAQIQAAIADNAGDIIANANSIVSVQNQANQNTAAIDVNAANIVSVQNQANQNTAAIDVNANNIISLQNQVNTNIANIALNDADILSLQNQVAINIAAITQNTNDIANLSLGGDGSYFEPVTEQELTSAGSFNLDIDNEWYLIEIPFWVQIAGNAATFKVTFNNDLNTAHYVVNSGFASPIIGAASGVNQDAMKWTAGKLRILNPSNKDRKTVYHWEIDYQNLPANTPITYEGTGVYGELDKIESVQITPSAGDFSAGSYAMVYGVPMQPTNVIPPHDWQAFINFADGSASAILYNVNGTYDAVNLRWEEADTPLPRRLAFNIGDNTEVSNVVRFEFDIESTIDPETLRLDDQTLGEFSYPFSAGRQNLVINEDIGSTDGIHVIVRQINAGNDVYIYSIRLYGTGTLPASLINYEVT